MTSLHEGPRRSVLSRTFSRHNPDDEEARVLAVAEAVRLARGKGLLPSPTELSIDLTRTCKTLPALRWHHWDYLPYKMKLTNTGCTVMVSAKWRSKARAHLTGGPLLGRYVFSQLHFHWGQEDNEGSEHTLEGQSFPLEMHMVLFKSRYLTQEAALKEMDGVVEVAYFFELTKNDNPMLQPLVDSMSKVKCAMKSTRLGPVPLSQLVPSFPTDYLLYMGSLLTGKCAHALTWIVHYQPLTISKRQLKALRSVHGLDGNPLVRNWRKAHPPMGRTVLHVLPAGSKITHSGDRESNSEASPPRESRHSSFSPDWTENEPEEEPPKKGRRFFGCFGKKNQDAADELMIVGSSGDSETTDTSINQLRLPGIAGQKPFCHPKVSESTFRAMCQASHLLSMSSSSQHSSMAGEDVDSRQETATAGNTESALEVTNAAKHESPDEGLLLLQPPELGGTAGAPFFNLSERRRSFGVMFLDQNDHHRGFMRPFSTLLSEVEEESDRTNEAVGDSAGNGDCCGSVAPERNGLVHGRLSPLESPPSDGGKKEMSTMKSDRLDVVGNGDARLSLELSTCSLDMPADSLTIDLSSPTAHDSEVSLLTVVHEDAHGSVKSDGEKLSPNEEKVRNVTSGASKITEPVHRDKESFSDIPAFHRYCKQGISWWVPFDVTSDGNDNDADGSSRDAAQPYPISKFPLLVESVTTNCFLGEEIFTDTSTTIDTPRTGVTACKIGTDIVSDSNQSTAQQSSEDQVTRDTMRRSQSPHPGLREMQSISGQREKLSENAKVSPTSEIPSRSLATNVSIIPEQTYERNDTWTTRTRAQKRFDEEELRFPEIKSPKRKNQKPKAQKKKTSLSMSTLQDMQQKNISHSVYQRTTKDGKVKDRLNTWREMQSRKRSSRKSENKKRNRSNRRHHSSSSMDHLFFGSSSDDQARLEKKPSKKFIGPAIAKTSGTVPRKDGYECQRRERSNSSSSESSFFSSSDVKCIDKIVNSGGIQELLGSGDEMQLQEISLHYVPFRAGATPQKRKHLITAADHGDSAVGKSPSKLRLHLKAPVDMDQLLKKVPSGSYITIDSPGVYAQEREVTVGMVLVDTRKCEDGNCSYAQDIPSVETPHNCPEKSESIPLENSKNLSTSAPAGDCGVYESATVTKQNADVDSLGTNQMETSEATTSHLSTIEGHCPCRNRCCNAECWICQLSTIKVIQYTHGIDNSRDLPTSEHSEGAVVDTPNDVKPGGNADEIAAVPNVSSIAVQRFSSVVSKTLGIVQCSGSNERVPLPEPVPVGDVPLQDNLRAGVVLPAAQNEISELKSKETGSLDPKVYRTSMELRLYTDGTILGGNSNTSSSGGERLAESSETSKEVLPEEQKVLQMEVYDANSSSCEETSNMIQRMTASNENKGAEGAKASTEIIDLYRKIKRRPQRKNFNVGGIPETPTMMGGLSSYTSCATESDVSLIPEEDEAVPVPQSSNTQSSPSGEEILTSENQIAKCTENGEKDGGDAISYLEHKSTLRRCRLEYELLSKVILYATLHRLGITSTSLPSTAGAKPCPKNLTVDSNLPDYVKDSLKHPLATEVVESFSKVPSGQLEDSNTKSTWTGPEGSSTTTPELSAAQQEQPVTPEAASQRKTEDTQERQQSVPHDGRSNGKTKCSDTQLSAVTSKTENNSRTLCTSGSITLYTKNAKLSNVVEENTSNNTEVESIVDSQETRYLEEIEFSSTSESSNATKRQPKKTTESYKTPSIASSANRPKMCSVEVRQKGNRPCSEPSNIQRMVSKPKKSYCPGIESQKVRKPKKRPSRDRILSPREVYERRKTYAQNLALRRAQKANHQAGSDDGERTANIDENQSVSEGKSVGEPPRKQCRSKNMKFVDGYQSAGSVKLGGTGSKSVSAGKGTAVKSCMERVVKTPTDRKARGVSRMPENFKAGRDASSCSTVSTKTNSASCGAKERAMIGSTSLNNDNKLGGARERSLRKNIIGQWRGDSLKEEDETSTIANSENSGGSVGASRTPVVVVNGSNGMKPSWILGQGIKSNTVNDPTERAPKPSKQRCATEKQSKKNPDRKTSAFGAVVLHSIEAIDKPSLCEMWVKQHYSDSSTLASPRGSVSIETAVQTVIPSTKKPGPNLIESGNAVVDSEKSSTPTASRERLNNQAIGGAECEEPTVPNPQASLLSRKCKVSAQSNGEQLLPPFGDHGRLLIPFRADAVPLLTYKPQMVSSDCLKAPHSDHVQETGSEKRPPPIVNSLRTLDSDIPLSRTDVGGKKKKSKPLRDKSHGHTPKDLSHPPSVHDRRSVATSPMPLRKNAAQQMSLTVEAFAICSTGVNTSLSVTELSSRSMAVQCPSRTVYERPSANTYLLQSLTESEVKRETQVCAASGTCAMLSEVATKLESELLVQKSVATQCLRHASVPNLALKSPEKKTEKLAKRGSSNKRSVLGEHDLGINEFQMTALRLLHRRRLFRAFSTNSLVLGTNEASTKKVMRRLFKKRRKKVKSDGTERKSKGRNRKKKEEGELQAEASGSCRGSGLCSSVNNTEANTDRSARSSATHCDLQSDSTDDGRKNRRQKSREADRKTSSRRLLLVRGSETPQSPALFEDLEGGEGAGPNWCSVHNRPADAAAAAAAAAATDADSDEVSAAVAQVTTGARVLRVSLADDESLGCADLGSVEFVVRGSEAPRQPTASPSVLARLRQMLTWRT